jgi:hypothetical protein
LGVQNFQLKALGKGMENIVEFSERKAACFYSGLCHLMKIVDLEGMSQIHSVPDVLVFNQYLDFNDFPRDCETVS